MFPRVFRKSVAAAVLLFFCIGVYGQFCARCEHQNLRNSVLQSENEKQYFHDAVATVDDANDLADIDDNDNPDSLVKVFSITASAIFLLFILGPLALHSITFRKRSSVHLQLLSSHSFLQTFRV